MTKRPKLSLSEGKGGDKKQAPGFETAPANNSEVRSEAWREQPGATQRQRRKSTARKPQGVEDEVALERPAWPRGRQVVRAVLVVAAAALSFYLLKRRFF